MYIVLMDERTEAQLWHKLGGAIFVVKIILQTSVGLRGMLLASQSGGFVGKGNKVAG